MKIHRNRWTAVGMACLLAVSAGSVPFMEWTGITVYAADATSGTCGENLNWNLTDESLTISGTGAMTNYSSAQPAPWFFSIKSVSIENGVTSIGDSAFQECSGLSSITIPNSVTSIGNYAFYGCSGLSSIRIPNRVTSIGDDAFANCSELSSITIPNRVTSIGNSAFYNCGRLSSITIPNSVTSIRNSAFEYCGRLSSITIPNSVTSIGDYAFQECSGLSSITIPNSVTSIGINAFVRCNSLNYVTYLGTEEEWKRIQSSFPTGIKPTFHIEHTWSDGKCTVCDNGCTHTNIDGQSMLMETEEKPPTCTEAGNSKYWTCSECGLKFADEAGANKLKAGGEVLQASGHSYPINPTQEDWKKGEESHWMECERTTCSDIPNSIKSEGVHVYENDDSRFCGVCGYDRTHKHKLTYVEAAEPTCTEAGNKAYYKCTECDTMYKDGYGIVTTSREALSIPATGHEADAGYEHDSSNHWKTCSVCGEVLEKESHSFSGRSCTVCEYRKPASGGGGSSSSMSGAKAVTTGGSSSTAGSWIHDEKGWWFRRTDGTYPKSGWTKLAWQGSTYWYYFNADGYMDMGWFDWNGKRYYLNPVIGSNSGRMLTGWQQIDSKWYYFSTAQDANEGSLLRSTTTPDGYRVDADGIWQQN